MEALNSRFTKAAAVRPEAPAVEVHSAHVSAAEVAALEDIALGEFYAEVRGHPPPACQPRHLVAVCTARAFVIAAMASLRADDLRKTRVESVEKDFANLLVDGPKPRGNSKRRLIKVRLPFRGSTPGVERWGPGWARAALGRSYVLEGFFTDKKYAGQVLRASMPSGELMPREVVTPALRDLVGARLGISAKMLQDASLTGHALRHYLTEVAVAGGWPETMLDPLGRWAAQRGRERTKRSAAASYSAGLTSVEHEFKLRVRAINLVRAFVGDHPWEQRLPVQRDGVKSFAFLFKGSNGDSILEEVETGGGGGGPSLLDMGQSASIRPRKRARKGK